MNAMSLKRKKNLVIIISNFLFNFYILRQNDYVPLAIQCYYVFNEENYIKIMMTTKEKSFLLFSRKQAGLSIKFK